MKTLLLVLFAFGMSTLSAGQKVLVEGRQIFIDRLGHAPGPTVILESGSGNTSDVWKSVQPAVAHFARVCSYDRAGLGNSDPPPQPQTADQVAEDLHRLLSKAKIRPPYILVGHSVGGIYLRKFDTRSPKGVVGMVLVDSSHEEQLWRFAKVNPALLNEEWPYWRDDSAIQKKGYLPPGALLTWQFRGPLIVIEHTPGTWPKQYEPIQPVWHDLQEDLASRSPDGKLETAPHSGHYIQRTQPELVIEAIREVYREATPKTKQE